MDGSLIERVIFISIIAILLFALAKYKYLTYQIKRKQKKRFARGIKLENEAYAYLQSLGYSIIGMQQIHYHQYEINGTKQTSKLILDYLVEKDGNRYIVEVKSGQSAIYINNSNTRRQLLEYDYTIQNDGIFLLDMENKKMQLVRFTSKDEVAIDDFRNLVIILAIMGIIIPFIKIKVLLILLLIAIWKYPKKSKLILSLVKPGGNSSIY